MDANSRPGPIGPMSSAQDVGGGDVYHARRSEVRGHSLTFTYLPYNIDRADFMILKNCSSLPKRFAAAAFALSIGAALPVGAALLEAWFKGQPISMGLRDWFLIAGPLVFAIVAALVAAIFPSERRALCRKIAKHFEDNPATFSGMRK